MDKNTHILYIGKAGGDKSAATLKKRIRQYLNFGRGGKSHYGGRYIWQLNHAEDLIVCWKELTDIDSEDYESELIEDFKKIYGSRPFANLKDGEKIKIIN